MIKLTAEELTKAIANERISGDELQKILVRVLEEKKLKIATAESCTGGLVSKKITEIPGASSVFDCGICSYSNGIKEKLLKVKKNTLDTVGAVSEETAMEMAQGVRLLAGSDIGISTTGIAGPGGGSDKKPLGLVYIGFSSEEKTFAVKTLLGDGGKNSREIVRDLASDAALFIALKEINA